MRTTQLEWNWQQEEEIHRFHLVRTTILLTIQNDLHETGIINVLVGWHLLCGDCKKAEANISAAIKRAHLDEPCTKDGGGGVLTTVNVVINKERLKSLHWRR